MRGEPAGTTAADRRRLGGEQATALIAPGDGELAETARPPWPQAAGVLRGDRQYAASRAR